MNDAQEHNNLFPVFLKPEALQIAIVGGGHTAMEKIHFLLKSSPNARIHLVAPDIAESIQRMASERPGLLLSERPFEPSDLESVQVLIVATRNRRLNEEIREMAKQKNVLVNVADTPELCDFYLGSIVTKGDLKIAISTNGKSPVLAKRIREYLESVLPESIGEILNHLAEIRKMLAGDFRKRLKILNDITSGMVISHKNPGSARKGAAELAAARDNKPAVK